MPGDFYGTVEVVPSLRRRASTEYSTGLDYSSCLLVDEDIVSRVRSLFLSRNHHWHPRTPNTSDEPFPPESEACDLVSGFDFGSAKSVAKLARQATGRLSVPGIRRAQSKSTMADLDQEPTQPLKSILRVSNSASDLRDPVGPALALEPKNKFRFPKLILRDKKASELEGIKSCVEISPLIPENDEELHETELDCCPPCDPADPLPSKYLVKHSKLPSPGLEIEAADLACFMSGCEPGLKNCSKHRRRSNSVSSRSVSVDRRIEEDFRSIPDGLAKMGISVKGIKARSSSLNATDGQYNKSKPLGTRQVEVKKAELSKSVAESPGRTRRSLRSPIERALSPISSVTSGSTMDAFPLAVQSLELAEMEQSPSHFSTTVATNFSLPGYRAKRASQSLRTKLAEISSDGSLRSNNASVKSKPYSPSLLSGASRNSVMRHALLKTSVTESQPIDTGLPVPPLLSTISSLSEKVMPSEPAYDESIGESDEGKTGLGVSVAEAPKVFGDSLTKGTAPHQSDNAEEIGASKKGTAANGEPMPVPTSSYDRPGDGVPFPTSESSASLTQDLLVNLNDKVIGSFLSPEQTAAVIPTQEGKLSESQRIGTSQPSQPPVDFSNAEYWGFVPAMKEAVQNAVQIAVRNAVQDIVVPPGMDESSNEYRQLVSASLTRASKNADKHIQRAAARNAMPTSEKDSESTVILAGHNTGLGEPETTQTTFRKPPNQTQESQSSVNGTAPIQSSNSGSAYAWKKGSSAGYTAIPTRHSSRNRVLSPKTKATNSFAKVSAQGSLMGSRKRSYERLISRGSRGLRSASSAGSLRSAGSADKRLGRKNTVHWLKDLLSTNGPYETRFTALPPRTRGARPVRSQTAPVKAVDELYLGRTPDPAKLGKTVTKPQATKVRDDKRTDISETFTRTIKDLENLMNEALFIARQATHTPDTVKSQDSLEQSLNVLRNSQKLQSQVDAPHTPALRSSGIPSRVSPTRCSDSDFSDPSIHESLRSDSGSSDSDLTDGENAHSPGQSRSITVSAKKLPSRHASGWPPTGRVSTPYPPASFPHSRASMAVEETVEGDHKPEFRTIEPFNAKRRSTEHRKSSAKSPRRLSPNRGTIANTTEPDSKETLTGVSKNRRASSGVVPLPQLTPRRGTEFVPVCIKEHSEEDHEAIRAKLAAKEVPGKQEVRDYIIENRHPPITPRASSLMLRQRAEEGQSRSNFASGQTTQTGLTYNWQDIDHSKIEHWGGEPSRSRAHEAVELRDSPGTNIPPTTHGERSSKKNQFSLGGKRHLSLRDHHIKGFSLARSHKRQTIARDWSPGRKRFVATVACISTALIGLLVGIYAGETPAIQYYIVDFHHYTVLGNVFFFIGLAIPTFFFWPLPLLHGRKPYIMGSMSLAMPLLFPQALAVGEFRSPYVSTWRVGLIMSRALMGFCLGFANMNFKQMLTDLFGASLQSTNPHQEHVDEFDVRRHGGGMGVWLGLWTWSALGSIGIGFMIGAVIINNLNPAWGFYVSICIIAFVMLLNVLCPEVRRSAFRRSVAEVVNEGDVSRRLARGEVKMHVFQTGPKWWGEEFHSGVVLTQRMLRQPGFLIMALYTAWIYGQQVLITLLLGALMSKDYKFTSPQVGGAGLAIPVGALIAIPFQKASLFSRARQLAPVSDDGTFKKKISWTSHMVRRSIFVLCLPLAGIAYTLSSGGPPIPFIIPILFAALIGFLSNLAMAECHGIIMETFDTSDLQPGMTGRSRGSAGDKATSKRTNYSSFPRVASGFAITQGFGYLIAAASSGVGGVLTRHLGQQAATGVMAGILLILSILLLGTLIRYTDVQIIPDSKKDEMEQYHNARRTSAIRQQEGVQEEEPWRPIIIGNPHHTTRRMCLLELGSLSRFSEIRLKNKLVDEQSLEAKHPNQAAMNELKNKIHEKEMEVVNHVRRSLSRHSSRGSRRSRSDGPEQGDLGGHREMLNRGGSGNGTGRPAVSRGASGRGSGRKGTSLARKGIEE
ncbi:hypothetical protein BKA65DRAFT_396391 [Rhexocercosporidium sp. MPI-PUGE-AT-0058]|nr:hypothetical protein BKA65DRAFT_396391 [Rhexocercosporidium sp. MPI-PUGE-AT-0058]